MNCYIFICNKLHIVDIMIISFLLDSVNIIGSGY